MNSFHALLEDMLSNAAKHTLYLDRQVLAIQKQQSLSVGDLHLIAAVGETGGDGCRVSRLARALDIAPSSASIAVDKLVKRGFVTRVRSKMDVRVVYVHLTDAGQQVYMCYRACRQDMAQELASRMTESEKRSMTSVMRKMNEYFRTKGQE